MAERERVVLAYSGGLDTSVAIRWINENYNMDVIALTIDMGAQKNLEIARERALGTGAIKCFIVDAREMFVKYFLWPALQAGALYEGVYPLATALGRPLIVKLLIDTARQEGAQAVAHGCTGKGNDQVRFDVGLRTLASDLRIIAPMREWKLTRDEELEYVAKYNIPVDVTVQSPYSTDENLWGRSVECGMLEDPWVEPPEDAFRWTSSIAAAPEKGEYIEIEFERGVPVGLNGEKMDGVDLIQQINQIAGKHGIGRIDHVENRLVGIKSREIYEAPAATVLHKAHRAVESLTLTRDALRFKEIVAQHYADLIYNGLWFSAFHQDLVAYVLSSQRVVSGVARMRLCKGNCIKVGVKSDISLYSKSLATYDRGDQFDHEAAQGFIRLHGLQVQMQAKLQLAALAPESVQTSIMPPDVKPDEKG